ncbi:MAG: tetratricopeptide repeat protein [Deltaproteobacteria bacterium]|nr:tetratricopeptide repeat protein [Deltaproteobacteria bacterium]
MKPGQCGWVAVALSIATCTFAAPVRAGSPDIWDIAVAPRLARDMAAFRDAQRALIDAHRGGPDYGSRRRLLLNAMHLLERADAVHSPDPRPRFLYGRVLARLAHEERPEQQRVYLEHAVQVLEEAIAVTPEHPDAIDARFALAVAYAKLGQPRKEIEVYNAILPLETSRTERALIVMNQAEAHMVLGDLDRAVQGYRASLAITPDHALAHWGLAVALDRSGDPNGAVAQAWSALQYDPNAETLHDDNVFFVPEYDRFWYDALGTMARASHDPEPALASLWWRDAAGYWKRYIEAASAEDRWVAAARSRLKLCERKQRDSDARALKRPLRSASKP